jgi:hypothetical protein
LDNLKQFLALNHLVTFVTTVVLLLASAIVWAEPVDIGTFDKIQYTYEASKVERLDNSVRVWVVSIDQKFNVTNDKRYVGMAVHLEIDCSAHTAGLLEEATFDKHGNILVQGHIKIPVQFWHIVNGKMTHALYISVCTSI